MTHPYLECGHIVNTHGIRGAVTRGPVAYSAALPWQCFPV